MTTLPLHDRNGHLFIETDGALWLLDTGAPASFGAVDTVTLGDRPFRISTVFPGLTAATLSRFVGVECRGLLGADVLSEFDFVLDARGGKVEVSTGNLECGGSPVGLDDFMGIPLLTARIRGNDHRMFFDTGAQISYFQNDGRTSFPAAGRVTDFYPGAGQFETETHDVEIALGGAQFVLRCGLLPGLLGATLAMAGAEGIVGNQILRDRIVGYFPRRRLLVL